MKMNQLRVADSVIRWLLNVPMLLDYSVFSLGLANTDPHYERVFLLDPQYQNPAVLRNKLPELSQSAEASGKHTGTLFFFFFWPSVL